MTLAVGALQSWCSGAQLHRSRPMNAARDHPLHPRQKPATYRPPPLLQPGLPSSFGAPAVAASLVRCALLPLLLLLLLVSWPWQYAGPKNSTAIAHFTIDSDPFAVQNCAAAVERSCDVWPQRVRPACPSGGATSYHEQDGGCRDQRDLCKSIPNLNPMASVINLLVAKLLLVQSSLATQALGAPLWARCNIVSRCPLYAPGMHVRMFEPSRPAPAPLTPSNIFLDHFPGRGLAPRPRQYP
ncbi:hypothetical protein BKA58DRAFT_401006 [Alternaria rosae]|uniref:uncharacterized protein n=1 Tax=Alternaria rosae TaxID=1187941 RepID=UPI001E8E5A55|nr:uncharacterized protein BKA58DRAFT_401006 [Alternaria rosae]KAH6872818.1 hypothetical protein BKA58DRAFT_401006 [Alternaria rosae]